MQAHAAIREDPTFEKKERKTPDEKRNWKPKKLTYDERKASLKVRHKLASVKDHSVTGSQEQESGALRIFVLMRWMQCFSTAQHTKAYWLHLIPEKGIVYGDIGASWTWLLISNMVKMGSPGLMQRFPLQKRLAALADGGDE